MKKLSIDQAQPIKKIKWLVSDTSEEWLAQAIESPIEILMDHAHCERKAAGSAMQLMFRYLADPGLADVLSPLAREELEHFEMVLQILQSRGKALLPLAAPPYGSLLAKKVRSQEPQRMLDSFLISGLIEARSHERMSLLASYSPDREMRNLYRKLLESEARHFGIFWKLAENRFNSDMVTSRLNELAQFEANILSELYPKPRMHS